MRQESLLRKQDARASTLSRTFQRLEEFLERVISDPASERETSEGRAHTGEILSAEPKEFSAFDSGWEDIAEIAEGLPREFERRIYFLFSRMSAFAQSGILFAPENFSKLVFCRGELFVSSPIQTEGFQKRILSTLPSMSLGQVLRSKWSLGPQLKLEYPEFWKESEEVRARLGDARPFLFHVAPDIYFLLLFDMVEPWLRVRVEGLQAQINLAMATL